MYYYVYYLFSLFARKYSNRDGDYAFTAIIFYFLFLMLNSLSILLLVADREYFKTHALMLVVITALIPSAIHYFALISNKKYLDVLKEYDEKYEGKPVSKSSILFLLLYVFLTIAVVIYVAQMVREMMLKS